MRYKVVNTFDNPARDLHLISKHYLLLISRCESQYKPAWVINPSSGDVIRARSGDVVNIKNQESVARWQRPVVGWAAARCVPDSDIWVQQLNGQLIGHRWSRFFNFNTLLKTDCSSANVLRLSQICIIKLSFINVNCFVNHSDFWHLIFIIYFMFIN